MHAHSPTHPHTHTQICNSNYFSTVTKTRERASVLHYTYICYQPASLMNPSTTSSVLLRFRIALSTEWPGYGMDARGIVVRFPARAIIASVARSVLTATRALSSGVKWPEREADCRSLVLLRLRMHVTILHLYFVACYFKWSRRQLRCYFLCVMVCCWSVMCHAGVP